mgnify:CR=1 FL=1
MRRTSVLRSKTLVQGRIHFARAGEMLSGVPTKQALWGRQKEVRNLGTVQLPSEAFMAALKLDE